MKATHIINLVLLFVLLSFSQEALAQKTDKALKEADELYNSFSYSLALERYKQILENGEPKLEVIQRIANSYRLMNNSREAEFWYAQVVSFPGADPSDLYLYAEAAKRNGNYGKAKDLFLEYSKKVPVGAAQGLKMAASCDTALAWIAAPEPYKVQKQEKLSSDGADFSPVKFSGGLLFASDRLADKGQNARFGWTGNGYVQLYHATALTDSTYATPKPLPAVINTDYHNGPGAYLEKEQTLYFTRTHSVKKGTKKANTDPTSWFKGSGSGGAYINRLGIYTSVREGEDKWGKAKAFKYNNTNEYSVGHPAITSDGNMLYFSSDMPGGLGETDIYYCVLNEDGSWSEPVNAGKVINTPGRESFPSIGADGNLYFSSDGHIGMGGLDVFRAVGIHKDWTAVENLKYPINSSHDDLGISMDSTGRKGMISSGRQTQNGFDDIYSFTEVRVPCTLFGKTIERLAIAGTDKKREIPVDNVLLQLFEENNGTLKEIKSDANGNFVFQVKAGLDYIIRGSKPGYLTQSVAIKPECVQNTDSVKVEMIFNRDTPNVPIVLENIYYDLDKWDIRPDAAKELDKLVQTLKDNPRISIELSSHTDSRQTHWYNQMLSELRAQAAVDYLILKGISKERLVAQGYGETQLLNRCSDGVLCSEYEHQRNRRTEFKILATPTTAKK
ncbi:OmpA family protein [Pontibacter harenae]|uniref:OmpA family protein n=1 Tax=Pontibacter harenae TaxID=2894083 RepID=UPI001E29F48E|nr:OmpA family protein [Pontibacter harenae]MCC9167353.1 OmpA family protein [Pontibacter harenae]